MPPSIVATTNFGSTFPVVYTTAEPISAGFTKALAIAATMFADMIVMAAAFWL